jgi:predicted Ser/Thr protein kinase
MGGFKAAATHLTLVACDRRASNQITWDELDVQDQIGGGGFSIVYRGFWRGTPVAIKRWFDPQMTDELLQEFRCVVWAYAAYLLAEAF